MADPLNFHNGDAEFVLVHGTFVREGNWCRTDSKFHRSLREKFPQATISVFNWSGFNQHRARIKAAQRLANRVTKIVADEPGRKIVLVGHSHGASVIRYSLGIGNTAELVSGVVALATPFIEIAPKSTNELMGLFIVLFKVQAAMVAFSALCTILVSGLIYVDNEFVRGFMRTGIFINLIAIPVFYVFLRFMYATYLSFAFRNIISIGDRLQEIQKKVFSTLVPPHIVGVPLLALAPEGDEARRLLTGVDRGVSLVSSPLLYAIAFGFLAPTAIIWWLTDGQGLDEGLFTIAFWVGMVCIVMPFALMTALLPAFLLPRGLHAPIFGGETIIENFVLAVTAGASPRHWDPYKLEPVKVVRGSFFKLRHCLIYEDDATIRRIAEWSLAVISSHEIEPRYATKPLLDAAEFQIPRVFFDSRIPEKYQPKLPYKGRMIDVLGDHKKEG